VISQERWDALIPAHKQILQTMAEDADQGIPPPTFCFAPDTDPHIVETFAAADRTLRLRFSLANRWTSTATNASTGSNGSPITLTWGIVPDGVSLPASNGSPVAPSNLRAFLDNLYGSEAVWRPQFEHIFDRWSQLVGVTYVGVTYDDGATFPSSPGVLNVRPDVRVGGKFIDGPSNILAYNSYPNVGDMVIDTGDDFFNDTSGDSRKLRNVVAHEAGHGLGLAHSCPITQTKLMEPFVSTAYDGPRHDDLRALHTFYGDAGKGNSSAATAIDLGSIPVFGSRVIGLPPAPSILNGSTASIDASTDSDWYKVTVPGPGFLRVLILPTGLTYDASSQNCSGQDGSCCSGTMVNSLAGANLRFEIRNSISSGNQIISTVNNQAAGLSEDSGLVTISSGGEYFVRVFGSNFTTTQLYVGQIFYSVPCASNSSGVIGYWPLEGNANDASGMGNNGSVLGDAAFTQGISGQGLALDGLDDSVLVPDSTSLNPTGPFSIAAWYKPVPFVGTGFDVVVGKQPLTFAPPYYQMQLGVSGSLYPTLPSSAGFSTSNGNAFNQASTPANALIPGDWNFLVGTSDGSTLRIYVNGVLQASQPISGPITTYSTPLRFGRFEGLPNHLPGTIDEVRMYGRALSPSEVSYLFTHQDGRPIVVAPGSSIVCPGGTFSLNVDSIETGGVNFRWRLNGVVLSDGPSTIGTVSGSITSTLTITDAKPGAQGAYDCILSSSALGCKAPEMGTSNTQMMKICTADFNCDGIRTVDDIFIYISAWFTNSPRCDVNNDSVISIDDIFIFLNIWFAGC
jgi:hypothetical protein